MVPLWRLGAFSRVNPLTNDCLRLKKIKENERTSTNNEMKEHDRKSKKIKHIKENDAKLKKLKEMKEDKRQLKKIKEMKGDDRNQRQLNNIKKWKKMKKSLKSSQKRSSIWNNKEEQLLWLQLSHSWPPLL